ncbi:vWA domain-containing protein [Mucilaginibacter antarcticus]|uniref:von Willebrand factor type A domain-containing protein n=3 Tax=Mucilaginibacter antarcticus TaxID=1855725 RepID=A0ABW5XKC4_9SPHI
MRNYLMTLAAVVSLNGFAYSCSMQTVKANDKNTATAVAADKATKLNELLKNMAAIEGGPDGAIGARFNRRDYSSKGDVAQAIKNLPTDILESIMVVDGYGDQSVTTNYAIKNGPVKIVKGEVKKITVTGKVLDAATKEPLTGCTVGTQKDGGITQADINGNYKVTVAGGSVLTFSFVGYMSQSHKLVPGQNVVNINLAFNAKAANEVVIRGYVRRDRAITNGKSYIITGREVQDNPVGNVEQLLQGSTKGAGVYGNAGAPGMRGSVNIRGLNAVGNASMRETRIDPKYAYSSTPSPGNEDYDHISENQFTSPQTTPLSTFAVDVDKASYANVRRFINGGQLPPKNAVRIEELINYFNYNLPKPTNGEPVAIQTEIATTPWNSQHQLVRIGLRAKDVKTDMLPASNLVFLVDVSGSMNEVNKLPLVKTALKMLVDQLRPKDRVALVTYAGYVSTALASTPANEKDKIKEAIDQLGAGGSTAGGAGLMTAYQVAQKSFIKKGNNRIIMATDGDFNVGAASNKAMEELIEEERGRGISLSILGFGMGNYKDSKMELLADKGHGNYAYIDNITEATKSMVTEFGGTLFTVAKDVKLQVEFNPNTVQAYRLLGYENRLMAKEDFNNDTKLGGDMGVNHTVTALYEIIPVGVKDDFMGTVDPLKYQQTQKQAQPNGSTDIMTVKFRYKEPDGEKSRLQQVVVNARSVAINSASEDMRFAASVAGYGMLLRNSAFKQNTNFEDLIKLAKGAKGKDDNGYRAEFIRLAESTRDMMKTMAAAVNK